MLAGRRRNAMVSGNASRHEFSPRMGLSCSSAEFIRTMRTLLVATAVGAVAGGGVVLSLADHSAGGQTSVAERTLVRPFPAVSTSVSSPQTNPPTINRRESTEISWADGQVNDPATTGSNGSSPARPAVVTSSAEVHYHGTSAKTAVAPSPTTHNRPKRVAQKARHKDFVTSSPPPQPSLAPRTDPNAFQRLLAGVTAAIEHVWPLSTLPADRTSRAHGANVSPA